MKSQYTRKANNALGICVMSLVFLLETILADHKMPNAASPYVWTVFSIAAILSLALHLRFKQLARRDSRLNG